MSDVFGALALACPLPGLLKGRRRRARWRDGTLQGALLCRGELARDRSASLFFGFNQKPDQELSNRPSAGSSYFSLLAQREVTKRKGTPRRSPSGILPAGTRLGSAGSRTAHPALRERAHVRVRAPSGLVLRPLADWQGPRYAAVVAAQSSRPQRCRNKAPRRGAQRTGCESGIARTSRLSRRATQPLIGERRGCSSAGMREFAPADQWRVAQGTGIAKRCRRDSRVAFLLVTSLWRNKEK